MNRPSLIGHTVQETDIWLNELCDELRLQDKNQAYGALRAVLHALRDRLTIDGTAHLASQMPALVRGIYYEGWKPAATPNRIRDGKEFVDDVRVRAHGHEEFDPDFAIRGVFRLLGRHVDAGQIRKMKEQLPGEIRQFWPNGDA